jgi:DNA invertase Pin-like site-specific DNA recombinase
MTAMIGYTRVSTTRQDRDAHLAALATPGVDADRVFTDKRSGSARTDRPGLAPALDDARAQCQAHYAAVAVVRS